YEHLKVKFDKFGFYHGHSSRITAAPGSWPWVVSSGCRGIQQIDLAVKPQPHHPEGSHYTIRLHFADPDNEQPGRRVFNLTIQDQPSLTAFDIVKEAGGRNRGIVKEFKGI